MARIYIVEDEPSLQKLYRAELESMGHEVVCKVNGKEAFRNLSSDQPDLVVLDIMMAEGDGMEFLMNILDSRMGIPVIINSAYTHYKNDFISWAAEAYVVKSSDLTELKAQIRKVLDRTQLAVV
jgi:DNA-binding response OmpR family regulator